MTQTFSPDAPGLPIGVVCRLTGVAPETLRAWERRHGLVKPSRAGGRNRLYSQDDLKRIALAKSLTDSGYSIGAVAAMPTAQLERLLERDAQPAPAASPRSAAKAGAKIGVIGTGLGVRLKASGRYAPDLAFVVSDPVELGTVRGQADLLALEIPTLHADASARVAEALATTGARRAAVFYRFSQAGVVDALENAGIPCIKGLPTDSDLRRAFETSLPAPSTGWAAAPAPSRFTEEELARIIAARPTIACECPRHLADLITGLSAFERYSAECEGRFPADAAVHESLRRTAAAARVLIEDGLSDLLQHEASV